MRVCSGIAALVLSTSLALVGCAETVQFAVLRPGKVNIKKVAGDAEPTVAVGAWGSTDPSNANYAGEVGQYLRELIVNAEGGVVKFTETNGAVTLNGTMSQHEAKEQVKSEERTCNVCDSNGKNCHNVRCILNTREGVARVRVSMNVINQQGVTVSSDTSSCEVPQSTSAQDQEPERIDWDSILLKCRHNIAAELARNVVPYRVTIQKPWFGCGDAKVQCQSGQLQLKASNFDEALVQFAQAEEALKATTDNEAKAAVEWAYTLAYEFSGDYAAAEDHIKRAISLNPNESAYAAEVSAIRQEEKAAQKLAEQGVH